MKTPFFNFEKSLQVILYIANKLERKDFHKIFKILYFSDREHLSKYGRVITGDRYIAMNAGPVPSNIYDIIKSVKGDGFFADNAHRFTPFFEVRKGFFLEPKKEADLDYLSESDVEILDTVLAQCANMSWSEIKDLSHDYAWNNTTKDRTIQLSNIMLESGETDDYIDFISNNLKLQEACM